MQTTGADLIIRLLEQRGVRLVAGIPGGALLPLYEALGRSTALRHILARHEQGAGFIAQGIARITGKAGVCFATSGPGVTNVVTAIADAKLDSVPLICVAGQVPKALIGTDAFQEVATLDIVRSITKRSYFVRRAEELPEIIREAFDIAESGRPGPVLIDVPKDVQTQPVAFEPLLPEMLDSTNIAKSPRAKLGDARAYELAAQLLTSAERPVLYVGGGIVKARAHRLVRGLAERAHVPVTTSLMALGALPPDHELNIGMLGMHGARYTNCIIDECDVLFAIGARFDDRATGKAAAFAPRARIVHIDIDAREFGKIKQPTLAIQANAHDALTELLERVPPLERRAWLERVAYLRTRYPLSTPRSDELCTPYGIVRTVAALAPSQCIVTTDVGQHQMWVAQAFPFDNPHNWLTSGGLGTMGFGLPAAIGAALAAPQTTVLCFTGDGSLLMNIQELATLAELDLNVKIILLDNAALGLVRQQQQLFYASSFVASMYSGATDFVAIARAFGVPSHDLGRCNSPQQVLHDTLNRSGPALIRVPIEARELVLPMVAPGSANTEALTEVAL